jgi:hypothetical protein
MCVSSSMKIEALKRWLRDEEELSYLPNAPAAAAFETIGSQSFFTVTHKLYICEHEVLVPL